MQKVLLIFANSSIKSGVADANELKRIMQQVSNEKGFGMQIFITYARNLSYFVSNERSVIYDHRNRMPLEDYEFVYFRRAGAAMQQMLSCAIYLEQHGMPFYDREILIASSRNKLSQMFKLQTAGVPIPPTFFCRHKTRTLRLLATKYAKELSFPLIVKATAGTRGGENYLVHDATELEAILRGKRRHFLIQAFIPNDGDLRVLVMNRQVRGVLHRKAAAGSHLNNTSQGGSAHWQEPAALSEMIRRDAEQAANLLRRDVAGVDIILNKDTHDHYVLEVNRAPQIEHTAFAEKKVEVMLTAIHGTLKTHVPPSLAITSLGREKQIVGRFEKVMLPGELLVVAKVDTGADTSSAHCERLVRTINREGIPVLRYSFSPSGEDWHETERFSVLKVRSSNGHTSSRYAVQIKLGIGNMNYNCLMTLSKRHDMSHNVLIGRRFLRDHAMVVDVGRRFVLTRKKNKVEI